jgi:ribonuclease HI
MQNLSSDCFVSVRLLHRNIHRHYGNCKSLKGNQIIVLTEWVDGGILQIEESKTEVMPELVAYVDGGCLGNPGPSGIGVVIQGMADGPVRIAKWIGHQDNNVAEYAALMEALQYAVALKAPKLHVYSDSEVVVRQMTGEYVCRSPRLYSLHWTCRKLARSLAFSISHVRREHNAEANELAQTALRRKREVPPPQNEAQANLSEVSCFSAV